MGPNMEHQPHIRYLEIVGRNCKIVRSSKTVVCSLSDFDIEKFKRGLIFFEKFKSCICLGWLCSLVVGFSVVNLLEPLMFTNMSDTPRKSLRRYLDTLFHLLSWHRGDIENPESESMTSLLKVRQMHEKVSENMNKGYNKPGYDHTLDDGRGDTQFKEFADPCVENDGRMNKTKTNFSQYDMFLVQCGFVGPWLMYADKFGIPCTRSDLEDYMYCWYMFGNLLGIEDKFNVCFYDYKTAFNLCKEVENEIIKPNLLNKPNGYDRMALSFTDGCNLALRFNLYTPNSIINWFFDGTGTKRQRGSLADELRTLCFKAIALLLYYSGWFRKITNTALE